MASPAGRWILFAVGCAALTAPSARGAEAPASSPFAAKAPPGARILPEGWFPPQPKAQRPALPDQITRAFIIPIHDEITDTTYDAVRRRVLRCRAKGAQIIIFDMDTPGGNSDPMGKIVDLILRDLQDMYTVAYVNPRAYSAGAIIALACNEIVSCPIGRFGDAMPLFIGTGGIIEVPDNVRSKVESAAKTEIRTLAVKRGYDVLMCEAMITLRMELWLIRSPEGELKIVDAAQWRGRVRNAPATTQPIHLAGQVEPAQWEYVRTIDGPNDLVTLTAEEAATWGFVSRIFASQADLEKHYGITVPPTVLEENWSEVLVAFLTSAPVMGVLIFVAVMCAYVEMHTPGFGLAGSVAIACFAILIGSRFLVGLATWWEIALFVLGLLLVAAELFVTPGFGILGISGIICCVVGLLAMIVPNAPDRLPLPTTALDWSVAKTGLLGLGIGFLAAIAGAIALARYLPDMPLASRLILPPVPPSDGPVDASAPIRAIQPGRTGVVERTCRPVGQVRFGELLVDAVADGRFIPAGAKVKATKNEGNRIVVVPAED